MKQSEVKVGYLYSARISGNYTVLRVDGPAEQNRKGATRRFPVTNLKTNRELAVTAGKLRGMLTNPRLLIVRCGDSPEMREIWKTYVETYLNCSAMEGK